MKSKTGVITIAVIGLATWLIPFPKRKPMNPDDEVTEIIPPDEGTGTDFRSRVVAIAASQVGQPELYGYAASALGISEQQAIAQHTEKLSWCGLFATWVLQRAGADVQWVLGVGIRPLLEATSVPKPGDVGYIKTINGRDVHHYNVIESAGDELVTSIDGNSTGGLVARRTRPISEYDLFFNVDSVNPERAIT